MTYAYASAEDSRARDDAGTARDLFAQTPGSLAQVQPTQVQPTQVQPAQVQSAPGRFPSNHPFGAPAPAEEPSIMLQLEFRFDFERHPIYSDCGNCLLHLFLRNFGPIEAHQPFLCLPLLGVDMKPAPEWMMQDIVNVRKLRRFGPVRLTRLLSQEAVHCCTIVMPFSTINGGMIQYAAENRHRFETLPDLKLTCIAGAGNYPSGKMQFAVPAADLKTYFVRLAEAGEVPGFGNAAATPA